jgi:hypothetical protein
MKTYIVCSDTNYDLMVHVVNAETEDEAKGLALSTKCLKGEKIASAWNNCEVYELDTETKGVVFQE